MGGARLSTLPQRLSECEEVACNAVMIKRVANEFNGADLATLRYNKRRVYSWIFIKANIRIAVRKRPQ